MVLTDATTGRTVADAIKVVPVEIETQMVSADAIKLVANDAEDVLYVQTDQLGAAQKMTDDGRAVVWDAAFTPFGEIDSILSSATNNQRPHSSLNGLTPMEFATRSKTDHNQNRTNL